MFILGFFSCSVMDRTHDWSRSSLIQIFVFTWSIPTGQYQDVIESYLMKIISIWGSVYTRACWWIDMINKIVFLLLILFFICLLFFCRFNSVLNPFEHVCDELEFPFFACILHSLFLSFVLQKKPKKTKTLYETWQENMAQISITVPLKSEP